MAPRRRLEVTDVLDVSAAKRLGGTLVALAAGEPLLVDCRAVHSFEDRALAFLAVALRESAGRIELLGLGAHQWRMLGYLGLGKVGRAAGGDHGDEDGAVSVSG
jgi:hypothetical protein